jgi:4-aminobutyrate aminotransferase/(S)-3-amino-2-methylpropionate transaminase
MRMGQPSARLPVASRGMQSPTAIVSVTSPRSCRRGLIVRTAGPYGNVVRLIPPDTIEDGLLDEGLDLLEEALAATAG